MPPKANKVAPAPADKKCTGYCLGCKETREMKPCEDAVAKNGRPMIRGPCVECGRKMNKFV